MILIVLYLFPKDHKYFYPYHYYLQQILPNQLHRSQNRIKKAVLTNPCLSLMLFVNFSLWKDTTFCIHCSPVEGESGWMYILFGISGSALPATIHRLREQRMSYSFGLNVSFNTLFVLQFVN